MYLGILHITVILKLAVWPFSTMLYLAGQLSPGKRSNETDGDHSRGQRSAQSGNLRIDKAWHSVVQKACSKHSLKFRKQISGITLFSVSFQEYRCENTRSRAGPLTSGYPSKLTAYLQKSILNSS